MKKLILLFVSVSVVLRCFAAHAGPPRGAPALVAATTAFFQKFVDGQGRVNYAAIKRNPLELKDLVRQIETFELVGLAEADRKAFYFNAYNVQVISEVVKKFPVESVQRVPGFFDVNTVTVAGDKLTLNDLEKIKISAEFRDPRAHFVLVCGALGCPKLRRTAYEGNSLDSQLTIQARKVLQDNDFVRLDAAGRKVGLSEIFRWYEADFKASGKAGLAYVNQYRDAKLIPPGFAVGYYPYDWALNAWK